MKYCPACHSRVSLAASFCGNCGKALTDGDKARDFELGRLAALETIKDEIRKWALGSITVVGIIFTLLAGFGVNALVGNAVADAVQKEMAKVREEIGKVYINVGQAQANQTEIAQILSESKAKLKEVEGEEARLEQASRESLDKERQLTKAIEQANMTGLIAKLKYDFYHVRDFSARIEIKYRERLPGPVAQAPKGINLELYASSKRSEMGAESVTFVDDTIEVVKCKLYAPFEDNYVGRDLVDLPDLTSVSLRIMGPPGSAESIHNLVSEILDVHVTISVNWMPLWDKKFDIVEATKGDIEGGDPKRFETKVDFKLPASSAPLTSRYESLFQNSTASSLSPQNGTASFPSPQDKPPGNSNTSPVQPPDVSTPQ